MARTTTVDPSQSPQEQFELFSVPAFDSGRPTAVMGREIGSTKQLVQRGDVLLSKIVPHIRRAWIVRSDSQKRLIASSEWIVFRGAGFVPEFLRHMLVSDWFHARLMRTVAGVGGSLLRARPAFVSRIQIGLPSVKEQRRIARILDGAEAIRAKRAATDDLLLQLVQATFSALFSPNADRLGRQSLASLCTLAGQYGAGVASAPYDPARPRYIRITDINASGALNPERVGPGGEPKMRQSRTLEQGDLLFARSGATVGKTYLHREDSERAVFAGYLIRFRPDPALVLPEYVWAYTKTAEYRDWVKARQRVVAQPNINARQYGHDLQVPVPSLKLQEEFRSQLRSIEQQAMRVRLHRARLDDLVAVLQHRAFSGTLSSR